MKKTNKHLFVHIHTCSSRHRYIKEKLCFSGFGVDEIRVCRNIFSFKFCAIFEHTNIVNKYECLFIFIFLVCTRTFIHTHFCQEITTVGHFE
ncbi:hypothetical protein ABEB36_012970 [Hypothenemus hampei]|uniref:Uncharacterized protein n=1 Tax=Hypothenemus hampei TaxID=57062 RepID=A0ABD1E6C3_HYPHA